MGSFNPKKFVNPDVLKQVSFQQLMVLLNQVGGSYIATRIHFPNNEDEFDYKKLVKILLEPEADYPNELADALYHISELTDSDAIDRVLKGLKGKIHRDNFMEDSPNADIALAAWLADRTLVERVLGEQYLLRSKSFISYLGQELEGEPLGQPDEASLKPLVDHLARWFDEHRRCDYVRVLAYQRGESTWFLIRHAMPPQRHGVVRDGKSTSTIERPEKHDIVVYTPERDELSIHTTTDGERALYQESFGRHFFGRLDYFIRDGKYTLRPLWERGKEALVSKDIQGIEKVILREVQIYWGGNFGELEIRKAADLFAAMEERSKEGQALPRTTMRATFSVKFSDVKRPRQVVIRMPNVARYHHEGDHDRIAVWLEARGFLRENILGKHDEEESEGELRESA